MTLSEDPERRVTIPITKLDQGGATSDDYSGVDASVTFESGEREQTITFTATDDTVDDDGESVKLTFGTLPDGVSAGSPAETVVSITDDDDPSVTVSFESATYTVDEGDTVEVKVTLSEDPERRVTIPITKLDQDGASSSDYSGVDASVTFESGEREQTITFSATDDTVDDDGESVKLTFGTLPAGVSAGSPAETVVSITDDDDPSVTVSFEQATYAVDEGDTVEVKVTLSEDPERRVTIPITKLDQDGASSSDYSGVDASVTFESGEREQTITFSATDDTVDDDGESVKLTFGTLPAGVSAGSPAETVVSITDDDDPSVTVSFEQATYAVDEGDTVEVKVTLSEDPERRVTIPITKLDQDGASNSDYSGVDASVTFESGEREQTITFSATDDTVDDDGESVKLTFGTLPTGVSAGSPAETVVSITDGDVPSVTASFESATYTVDEGDTVEVKVTLSEDPERRVTIPITKLDQDGASSSDYSGVDASVTFESGEREQTITFSATDDTVDDDGESVKLTFGTLPDGVIAGSPAETVVSITDGDVPSVTASFESATYTVDEGDTVEVKVTLSEDPERRVTIPITKLDQDGASSSDYSGVDASVTFESGEREQPITFSATDDTVDDDGESVKLTFGTLPAGVIAGSPAETVVSITDDDVPSVTASFESATYTVDEGDTVEVKVTLSEDPERRVTIPITKLDQDGASSSDYSGVDASVTFESGEREQTITFSATDDTVDDDGESVKLTFGTLPDGVSAGSPAETVVSITDDDDPSVTVSFEQATYAVDEGDTVEVKVTLSEDPERRVTIPLTKANQGGASSADYGVVPANLTFNSGDTEQSFTFSATDDTVDDDDESVKLGFGTLPTGVTAGSPAETVVSITDDDGAGVSVDPTSLPIDEGSAGTYTVVLGSQPTDEVTITPNSDNGDVTMNPASLTFSTTDWSEAQTVTVTAAQDSDAVDERATITHVAASSDSSYSGASVSNVSVAVTDDDTDLLTPRACGTGELPADTSTSGVIVVPEIIRHGAGRCYSEIDTPGDRDWIKIYLKARNKYQVDMLAEGNAWTEFEGGDPLTLYGPLIYGLYHEDDLVQRLPVVDSNDRTGAYHRHVYQPTESGWYYIDVRAASSDSTGSYAVQVFNFASPICNNSSSCEETSQQQGTDAPERPQGLTGTVVHDVVSLTWADPGDGSITGYQILRRDRDLHEVGDFLVHVDDTGTAATSYADRTVAPEGSYVYRVKARNEAGLSQWSRHFRADTPTAPDPAPNSPAAGAPVIRGMARVDETLTADTSGIADDDGLENVVYGYQWTLSLGLGSADIPGATDAAYTPIASDEGITIRVRVSFTDDAGHEETLTSAATPTVAAAETMQAEPPAKPTGLTGTVAHDVVSLTWEDPGDGSITGYQILRLDRKVHGLGNFQVHVDDTGTADTLYVDTDVAPETHYVYRIKARNAGGLSNRSFYFNADTPAAPDPALNNPATGAPSISGMAQVGETLTADTSSIADADGLTNASYSYQWIANDGTSDTDITGATDSTYTLVAADEGKTIKVRVSFTDDADNEETLTSAATAVVASRPNSAATGAPSISGTAQVGETLTAETSGIADADGLDTAAFSYQWLADDIEITGATSSSYTLTADDEGKTIKVQVSFTDDADNEETLTSAATAAVAAAEPEPNSPATGEPTITGIVQVGETLTADPSGVGDADGLDNATFSYQWIRNDGASDTDIPDATDSTYTLVAADEGRTVRVKVSFTDDAGNGESLTSAATETVETKPNSPATGVPTITGTAQVGETLSANTSGIADADGLANATFSYQWISDDGTSDAEIQGATDSTYTLVAADESKTFRANVSFTDDAGNDESLTSAATATVAAEPEPEEPPAMPTGLTGTVAHDAVSLTWDDPGDDSIAGYQILRRNPAVDAPGQFQVHVEDTGSAATSYVDRDVETETRYVYRIKARSAAGLSERSDYFRADTPPEPEPEPVQNSPATGVPTISGTLQVGETLTADTSGIADANGMSGATFSYQWIVSDGGADFEIPSETGPAYTLISIDAGLYVMVRVTFTDDAGNRETLTSAATDVVLEP